MTAAPRNGTEAGAIEEAVARTGMRAERWSSRRDSPSVAAPADVPEGVASGGGEAVQEALSPPLPTQAAGEVVFRIHGMDCGDEVAALKREVAPLIGEDRLAFDLMNGRMAIAMAPDAELEARI